jgi:glycosyltransferase involved in cell wall biosynthesis
MKADDCLNSITLFIFRSNARGMQYGIGTYLHELTESLLSYPNLKIVLVSYKSSDVKEISKLIITDRYIEIKIPQPLIPIKQNNAFENKYASVVVKFLHKIIAPDDQVIFQFNYIDDLPILLKVKESFLFRAISIVHFAQFQQIFEGKIMKIGGLNLDKPVDNIEFTLSQEREMYRQSDHIVSVTGYMKEFLINEYGIKPDKISVIKNGLNQKNNDQVPEKETTEIRRRFGFGENEIILLFSGRIDPCKGINYLMEAFEQACRKNNSLRLIMLGQGSIQDCQKITQSYYGKITYTGFLPRETVTQFYKIADIGISPSVYDHCPYTVLEMMANKIPLIMTRINGLDELLPDDECIFIDPRISSEGDITFSIEEMTDSILSLAADKERRTRLAAKSYKTYERKFTAAGMAEEMHKLFYSLIKHKKPVEEYETGQGR